jgi:hypothetical protein
MSELIVAPNLDDTYLDKRLAITFETTGGDSVFYPLDAQNFIDGLVSLNEDYTTNILSEDEDLDPDEHLTFLSESVLGYLDSNLSESETFYYTNLKDFLENNVISAIEIEVADVDEPKSINDNALAEQSLLESIDAFIKDLSLVTEVKFKKVIRGGVVKKVIDCPPGFKSVGGKCIHMTASEARKRAKAAFKANKTRKKHMMSATFVKALEKKRKKSMKIRNMKHLK